MPIYEYECTSCGEIVEEWQKFSDPPLERCKRCGGKMRKLISQSTFHLKGTGWYVTDYARKQEKRPESKKKEEKKDSTKKKDTE
ncbi:MAG TPA: zinc ribbon domain-containing protein [Desulfobacteraceae bacterium]|nr:zinc ribbon domain-containing protein [Desulfobacteraceae bacterium]